MKELLHPEPFDTDNAAPVRRDTRYPRARAEPSTAPIPRTNRSSRQVPWRAPWVHRVASSWRRTPVASTTIA